MSEGNAFEPCFECPAIPQACEASDADYVSAFMRDLADPGMRIAAVQPNESAHYGAKGKAAILAALTENVQLRADRDSWKNWAKKSVASHVATDKELLAAKRDLEVERQTLQKCCGDLEKLHQGAFEQANDLIARCDCYYRIAVGSVIVNIMLLIALFKLS